MSTHQALIDMPCNGTTATNFDSEPVIKESGTNFEPGAVIKEEGDKGLPCKGTYTTSA